jgi:putative pyruvate formate lyase activating enzyme
VSSSGPHFGEEAPLVGAGGSGTIFLSHCNLGCLFCQNEDISHGGGGRITTPQAIASTMLGLQKRGCHNINFVTPTHQAPFLLEAVLLAIPQGLKVPVVWNCGGYESMESLTLLDGIVDIYMPDFKYWDEEPARRYSLAGNYPEVARAALKEMHRQVGILTMDNEGVALRGLLIRHLVMPGEIAGTGKFVEWAARELSPDTYVNIMAQYHPSFRAHEFPELNRRITAQEYRRAVEAGRRAGLRLDCDVAPRASRLRLLLDLIQ